MEELLEVLWGMLFVNVLYPNKGEDEKDNEND